MSLNHKISQLNDILTIRELQMQKRQIELATAIKEERLASIKKEEAVDQRVKSRSQLYEYMAQAAFSPDQYARLSSSLMHHDQNVQGLTRFLKQSQLGKTQKISEWKQSQTLKNEAKRILNRTSKKAILADEERRLNQSLYLRIRPLNIGATETV